MEFAPGDVVPASGVYRVEHQAHRLMHEATLLANTRFPRCKRCKDAVRFSLSRKVDDNLVLPFSGHLILEEYPDSQEPPRARVV